MWSGQLQYPAITGNTLQLSQLVNLSMGFRYGICVQLEVCVWDALHHAAHTSIVSPEPVIQNSRHTKFPGHTKFHDHMKFAGYTKFPVIRSSLVEY